jgi:hypothetical protein
MVKALWVHNCVMQETLREIREIEKLLGGTMSALRKELALHSGDDLFTLDERKEGGGHGKEWRDREAHIDELFRYCAILRVRRPGGIESVASRRDERAHVVLAFADRGGRIGCAVGRQCWLSG